MPDSLELDMRKIPVEQRLDPDPKLKNILTIDQAAELLGIHPNTIKRHYYITGKLRGRKIGNTVLIHPTELQRFDEEMGYSKRE